VYTADWEGPTRDPMVGMQRIQVDFARRGVAGDDKVYISYLSA
jgi:XTP/dITP diphosphohydrolase